MATAETVNLGPPHEPKEESIKAFDQVEHTLKSELIKLRHKHDKHEPEYFQAASSLSDAELAGFTSADFVSVRVAVSAYGIHLFGRIRIPALADKDGPSYLFVRIFSTGPDDEAKFHSFYTEEKEHASGDKTYRAIFSDKDELEWFDS